MAKPLKKVGGRSSQQLFELLRKANPSRLLSQYTSAPRPLEFPYTTPGAGRIPSGAPINMPSPPYPQLTAGAGGRVPWWKPTGAGMGKIGRLASLGGAIPLWGQIAMGAAVGGTELWKALTPKFQAYVAAGGRMGHTEWDAAGRPKNPRESGETLPVRTEGILKKAGITADMSFEEQQQALQDYISSQKAIDVTKEEAGAARAVRWDTIVDEDTQMVVMVGYNRDGEIVDYQPTGQFAAKPDALTKWQEAQIGSSKEEFAFKQAEAEKEWTWREQQATAQREYEDRMFQWQQQVREQEMAAERERQLAQLRANPASWLEYASLAGETPGIQPWMLPLMPGQYAGLQAGGAIPGYQAGGEKMNLPGLVTPSAQYMSRISPSMRQQYYGYEKARTGALPEDVQWRLWSQGPPGGMYRGLRRTR